MQDPCEYEKNVTFEFQFRLLSNVTGVYLSPENCPAENGLDLSSLTPDKKSSVYTMTYIDHEGIKVSTNPKVWINDF